MDKAKINAAVKEIKKLRSQKPKEEKEKKPSSFDFQVSSKPEKVMIGLGLAAALAILFEKPKNKRKEPLVKSFAKRTKSFYGMLDSLLDSTVAAELKRQTERQFQDEKLEKMEIERAEKITIYPDGKKFYT